MKDFNLSAWAVQHRPLVLFLLLATLVAGVFSFTRLGRLEDPVFEVPSMTVTVAWPGASAQQVQDQVLNRLERALQELDGLDNVRSFARQGFGGITLWMRGGTDKAGLEAAWYQARKKVGDIRHELPEGVRGPFFNDEFTDVYGVLYALAAPDLGFPEMHALAEDVKRALQAAPGVVKVDVMGRQAEQVHVEFSSQRLAAMGLTPQLLIETLSRQSALLPAGAVDGRVDRGVVRVAGVPGGAAQVAALPIAVGDRLLKLSDVADVRAALEDPPSFTVRRNGEPVLALGVVLSRQANVLHVGQALDAATAALAPRLPLGVSLEKYADQPQVVEDAVWEFERAFLEALAIVLAVCFVALGWRSGVVVAASVPLVLGLVAIVMVWRGWALDRISLGALIIALGLLVDDAIIAVEMMVVKIEEGYDRVKAAGFAWTSTAFPMLTGTLVTVAGFMPVGFAHSISGQYAGGIFWVVGVALLASWVVAVVFTPYLGVKLLPKVMKPRHHGVHEGPLYARMRRVVGWAVARRGWVLAGTLALFVVAGAGMGLVQQQFFPTASRTELLVDLQLREGASFAATQAQVKRVEDILKADAGVQGFTAYTGAGTPRFFLSLSPELPNPGYAQFVVQTPNMAAREAVRTRLRAVFDAGETFPDLRGRVQRLEFGPPVGYPVQFRVIGPEVDEVRRIAARVRDLVRQSPLVRDTHLEWNEQVRTVRVVVDQDRAQQLGLATQDIAATVQTALSGAPVAQLRRGEELIDVVLRAQPGERRSLQQLEDLPLFTRAGVSVPLSQVAQLMPDWEEPVLWRRNRDMTLNVRSDLAEGVQGPYATQQIWPSLQPVLQSLPPGYRIELGGAIEESDKSNVALAAVFPAMFAVTLLILMLQLQSFSRMALVFLTAPLGLIGVVPALLLFNAPFGFVALLGVIALGGMIMRNAVILVDQIDRDIAAGSTPWTAIVEATVRRARPVVLTAAAAILAMIPLTRSIFWGPMAMSIMGGLVVATALTLVVVPALYAAWFRVRREAAGAVPTLPPTMPAAAGG
ncbi:efflux RND transporter permease subunit [Azohydromonas lata]|uniref:Efflux RND transporter permease subunit n=1 Tax=Azohydromonas lata TaxID=45677 RepID=A0ABU5IM69_9BURK|nr:efflux RND transporter permease subunit [Azohydromonas lata]MDZ5459983.1 efflux RND transporter permease subunit [Azohydromonas lata]